MTRCIGFSWVFAPTSKLDIYLSRTQQDAPFWGRLFLCLWFVFLGACDAISDKPPNVIVIMADDHAQWATGVYGNPIAETPNIDELAVTGTVFDNAMAISPVCSPARASFFTGKLPSQHGVHDFLSENPEFDANWLDGEVLLSERLSELGYRTALVGKWHATTNSRPPQRGFDYWLSYDPFRSGWQNQYVHDGTVGFSDQGEPRDETGVQAEFLTDEALRFIDDSGDAPFFLSLNFVEPHEPFAGLPERLVERYRGKVADAIDISPIDDLAAYGDANRVPDDHAEKLAQYLAAVTLIDEQVGRLIIGLHLRERFKNTLIVYTSDHGMLVGQRGLYGKGNATRPPNFYEPTIRVPLIVRVPGRGGERRTEFVDVLDLHATILDYASAGDQQHSNDRPGRSMRSLIDGRSAPQWPQVQFAERGAARMATDGQIKLVRYYRQQPPHESVDYWYEIVDGVDRRLASPPEDYRSLSAALETHFGQYEDAERTGRRIYQQSPPNARVAREALEPDPF